jgi:hypothetical protein
MEAATGHAVFALRSHANDHLYLLRADSVKSAGEANIRVAAVTPNGHLRVAFQRGPSAPRTHEVPPPDLRVPLGKIPTLPRSGFRIADVRRVNGNR